jgi:hypothetical protein
MESWSQTPYCVFALQKLRIEHFSRILIDNRHLSHGKAIRRASRFDSPSLQTRSGIYNLKPLPSPPN